jgi:hypothetical protein
MSLPGDENPNPQWQRPPEEKPQWTSGDPLGDRAREAPPAPAPEWQHAPQSEWQRAPQNRWQPQSPAPSQPHPGWVPPPRTPGQAYASMILGILGIFPVCPVVLSVIALALGVTAKNEIDRSGGMLRGSGIALTGIITGGIGLAIYVLFFLFVLAL